MSRKIDDDQHEHDGGDGLQRCWNISHPFQNILMIDVMVIGVKGDWFVDQKIGPKNDKGSAHYKFKRSMQ